MLRAVAVAGQVCVAKTQYSLSSDPALKGVPTGFTVNVRIDSQGGGGMGVRRGGRGHGRARQGQSDRLRGRDTGT